MPDHLVDLASAVEHVLPHTGPSLIVREVLECSEESCLCRIRFPEDSGLIVDGEVATHLLVEPAAQAAAIHLAILATEDGAELASYEGFLTSAKDVQVTRPTIPAATDLQLRVKPRGKFRKPKGGLFKCRFEAERKLALLLPKPLARPA